MARVLCLHGMGGTGATMAPIADALRAGGHVVEAPTLPGHGTTPEQLIGLDWADWLHGALSAMTVPVDLVVGQSMGAVLALDIATRGGTRGVVAINPLGPDPDALDGLEWRRERGTEWIEVAPSTVGEIAYDRIPIGALLAMVTGVLAVDLAAVTCPVLVVTSVHDEVVDPDNSVVVAGSVSGPVERLRLERSGHVVSLDVERDTVITAARTFLGA